MSWSTVATAAETWSAASLTAETYTPVAETAETWTREDLLSLADVDGTLLADIDDALLTDFDAPSEDPWAPQPVTPESWADD